MSKLRLPIQAVPVNRLETLEPYAIVFRPQPGVTIKIVPEATPLPDRYSFFYPQIDQRLGICSVLSSYAVARCFQAGGLF